MLVFLAFYSEHRQNELSFKLLVISKIKQFFEYT
ncbi:MAG: hypothetical protein ACI8VT_004176 [Saprospiraceae bacterium]|jgi:hypothetical protein